MSSQTPKAQRVQAKIRSLLRPTVDATALGSIPQPLFLEQGTVVSVDATTPPTVTITLGGSSTSLSGVRYNLNLAPTAGMGIWVFRSGNDLLVNCTLA